jgi:hypothetical protein
MARARQPPPSRSRKTLCVRMDASTAWTVCCAHSQSTFTWCRIVGTDTDMHTGGRVRTCTYKIQDGTSAHCWHDTEHAIPQDVDEHVAQQKAWAWNPPIACTQRMLVLSSSSRLPANVQTQSSKRKPQASMRTVHQLVLLLV